MKCSTYKYCTYTRESITCYHFKNMTISTSIKLCDGNDNVEKTSICRQMHYKLIIHIMISIEKNARFDMQRLYRGTYQFIIHKRNKSKEREPRYSSYQVWTFSKGLITLKMYLHRLCVQLYRQNVHTIVHPIRIKSNLTNLNSAVIENK